ncbi:MAG: lipoyl synthase [Mycobacterium sp.]|nr:lipoyl synthase [Mycobacterium sp.]
MTVDRDGRKLLRLEVRNAETPIERKPPWIKTRARMGPEYTALKGLVRREGLHTVCEEAGCPNIFECWEDREATFLIGGEQCTRRCDFCQIDTGKPADLDRDEPRRVAESVAAMGLKYATVTGVARDDLPDGGAWLYAETVRAIKALNPATGVELLIPDFNGNPEQLAEVFGARPEVLAHNLETVPRIFKRIRPAFRYQRSLEVLSAAREADLVTKSNLILGMGETVDEVHTALADLHAAGCDIVTITQYLRPSPRHHPVERWVHPDEFTDLAGYAESLGFAGVLAGPLVRSSYRAGRLYQRAASARGAERIVDSYGEVPHPR